jgi:tRNA nucleotidyltransferase/poly(A) polymerase
VLDYDNLRRTLQDSPIASRLPALGLQGYLVGGFIRDALLGAHPREVDIVLEGDYEDGLSKLSKAFRGDPFSLGGRFRTYRMALAQGMLDISPVMGDRRADDLLRRDFTVDALALDFAHFAAPEGRVIDLAEGCADLARRHITAISEKNFVDDPLRILRAFRLMVQLGFTVEDDTAQLILLHAAKLPHSAPERIREELMLMLGKPDAHRGLKEMDALGVLGALFPEVEQMRDTGQNSFHHLPVLAHSLEAVRQAEHILATGEGFDEDVYKKLAEEMQETVSPPANKAAILKLSLLFHDLGKPDTAMMQENGKITFYGHQSVGADKAEPVFERLRLSNRESEMLRLLIEEHLRVGFYCNNPPPSPKLIYRFGRKLGDATAMSCLHAVADARATRGPDIPQDFVRVHEEVAGLILRQRYFADEIAKLEPLLAGDEIMRATGLPSGPRIGELKELLLEAQVEGAVGTREEAEAFVQRRASIWR